jgi:PucR family transcriptional regulator, purine catabolism regulatory protein
MQNLHARMLGALLAGEGLRGVAELAAVEAGRPVAIVLPARGLSASSAAGVDLADLVAFAARRGRGEAVEPPEPVEALAPVLAGDEPIGLVAALHADRNGLPPVAVDREEVLRTAALAALTEVAVADARDEVAREVRGSLLEDLRSGGAAAGEVVPRAARLGCDLGRGAVALVAEVRSARPRHAAALVASEHQGAIAEPLPAGGDRAPGSPQRIYAILPARGGDDAPERTAASARGLADRLRAHGPAAFSSFYASPADLGRAVAEAELMLEVIAADERIAGQLANGLGDGVYRLLFRAMATDPDEVRRFYSDTVAPLVEHDREYRTDLLGTLESYLGHDCNMNATSRAVYAHRHTVAHRLARVRELTGLDPALGADRERLGLGIKAYRILEPTLPR